jgi:hypothetical protein
MTILILLFALICLSYPSPARAQIPLFYQLLQAYHPSTITAYSPPLPSPSTSTHTPQNSNPLVPKPTGQILGAQTTIPPIGGDGKIPTIVVLGDSMIDTLNPGLPQLAAALQKLYPAKKFNLINYGYGASNIEYGLYRLTNDFEYLDKKYSSLISLKPDLVVIESFAYNNFGNTQSGIDRQWLALGAITTILKEQLPDTKIVLASTIAPNSVVFGNGIPGTNFSALEKIEKTKTIKLYLQNLVNFATSQNFPLADAYHPSLINGEGNRDYINQGDNLHPSGPGGEFFCQTVAQTIFNNQLID